MQDESSSSNVKDVIEATTGLVQAVPIYEDLVQPAAREVGTALGTVAKAVNVALAPISMMVWSYDSIKSYISTSVSKKLENVPTENIVQPNPVVAVPAIEALRYTGHDETLREMYANLLANAIDVSTQENAHPSFVEIIKQLSPKEALLLKWLSEKEDYPEVCTAYSRQTVRSGWGHVDGWRSGGSEGLIESRFVECCEDFTADLDFEAALDNFRRLLILDVGKSSVQELRDSFVDFDSMNISESLELEVRKDERLFFTSFGMKFVNTCVTQKI